MKVLGSRIVQPVAKCPRDLGDLAKIETCEQGPVRGEVAGTTILFMIVGVLVSRTPNNHNTYLLLGGAQTEPASVNESKAYHKGIAGPHTQPIVVITFVG